MTPSSGMPRRPARDRGSEESSVEEVPDGVLILLGDALAVQYIAGAARESNAA